MQVVVTGGSGQLGTVVLRKLLADRAIKRVISLDLKPPIVANAKLSWAKADVRDGDIGKHFEGCDALVHLAFVVTVAMPRAIVEAINVEGSKNVFRAAVTAKIKKIAYASSIAAYGVTDGQPVPLVEDSPRRFVEDFAYSATKYQVEAYLDDLEASHPDIAVVRMRPGILFGTHMDHPLGEALKNKRLVAIAEAPTPLVWDEDVADAFHLALKKDVRGAFNLCTDDSLTTAELARVGGMRVVHVPKRVALGFALASNVLSRFRVVRPIDAAWIRHAGDRMVMSNEKAKRELGWAPRAPTSESVMRRWLENAPGRTDPRIAVFMKLAELGAKRAPRIPDAATMKAHVHLSLTGPGGGDWTIHVVEGRISIEKGIPRPPTSVIFVRAKTFLELMTGKAEFATSQMTGKIRVEGEPMSILILGGMIRFFREGLQKGGPQGVAARRMERWMAQP